LGKIELENRPQLNPKTRNFYGKYYHEFEKKQVMVFEQLKRKEISQSVAAQILNVSPRWISEKQKRYLADGIQGVLHKNRGKPSGRTWSKSRFSNDKNR
jgi:hypothetical protein